MNGTQGIATSACLIRTPVYGGAEPSKSGRAVGGPLVYRTRWQQSGIAAVEFAVIMPILVVLLSFPIFFGRVFMHYTVIQKAAQDAAVYLSSAPLSQMRDPNRAIAVAALTKEIAQDELGELKPGGIYPVFVEVQCDGLACGFAVPTRIRVVVRLRMYDDLFNFFTHAFVGQDGVPLTADITMPYVGS